MTRIYDASFDAYFASTTSYSLAKCYRIVRKDGVIFAFTDHDKDLTVDLGDAHGSLVYKADTIIEQSEMQNKASLGSSNTEISSILFQDESINVEEVLQGLFDDAELDVFKVRWDTTPHPVIRGFCGLLSEAVVTDNLISVNYRSFAALYDQSLLRVLNRGCQYELGNNTQKFNRCFVQLEAPVWLAETAYTQRIPFDAKTEIGGIVKPTAVNPQYWFIATTAGTSDTVEPTWPVGVDTTVVDNDITWKAIRARERLGTVTAVTDRSRFTASGINMQQHYWRYGKVTWLTGANAGNSMEVWNDNGSGAIELFDRMMPNIQIGDTFKITAGCDHFKATCKDKFDNIYWFGGFDDAPGVLDLYQTP